MCFLVICFHLIEMRWCERLLNVICGRQAAVSHNFHSNGASMNEFQSVVLHKIRFKLNCVSQVKTIDALFIYVLCFVPIQTPTAAIIYINP